MIKIELVKFEAQDVITASPVVKPHEHVWMPTGQFWMGSQKWVCICGKEDWRR